MEPVAYWDPPTNRFELKATPDKAYWGTIDTTHLDFDRLPAGPGGNPNAPTDQYIMGQDQFDCVSQPGKRCFNSAEASGAYTDCEVYLLVMPS